MVRGPISAALLVSAVVVIATACGGSADKAGGARSVNLTLEAPDGANDLTDVFVREAERLSNGTLKIVVEGESYSSADPANEARLAAALRTGEAALALLPSRAWESQGISTFRALQAPFLVSSDGLLRRIVNGPISTQILRGTGQIDVIGLALLPDSLRRTLGRRPFTSTASLRGARIRIVDSATTAAGLRALGANPVTGYVASDVGPGLAKGRLDGAESSAGSILDNNYQAVAKHLPANVVLFAKTNTIAIGRKAFERLSSEQQKALREAAAATLAASLEDNSTDAADLERLCQAGVQLARATPADLTALRQAVEPVYEMIRRDPATAKILDDIEQLKSAAPPVNPPATCESKQAAPKEHSGRTFPEGTYVTTLTANDFQGFAGNVADQVGTYTITLRDGHFRHVLTPARQTQPPGFGIYTVHGDELTLVFQSPDQLPGVRETVRWSYYRGELSFTIVSVADSAGEAFYTAHPWRKIR